MSSTTCEFTGPKIKDVALGKFEGPGWSDHLWFPGGKVLDYTLLSLRQSVFYIDLEEVMELDGGVGHQVLEEIKKRGGEVCSYSSDAGLAQLYKRREKNILIQPVQADRVIWMDRNMEKKVQMIKWPALAHYINTCDLHAYILQTCQIRDRHAFPRHAMFMLDLLNQRDQERRCMEPVMRVLEQLRVCAKHTSDAVWSLLVPPYSPSFYHPPFGFTVHPLIPVNPEWESFAITAFDIPHEMYIFRDSVMKASAIVDAQLKMEYHQARRGMGPQVGEFVYDEGLFRYPDNWDALSREDERQGEPNERKKDWDESTISEDSLREERIWECRSVTSTAPSVEFLYESKPGDGWMCVGRRVPGDVPFSRGEGGMDMIPTDEYLARWGPGGTDRRPQNTRASTPETVRPTSPQGSVWDVRSPSPEARPSA